MEQKTDYSDNLTLIRQYKTGNNDALEELMQNNLKLIKSIALRFTGRGCELEDLIEIGAIGFLKAIDGFDEKYGCALSTYAFPLICGEIKRFLRDDGLIKISRSTKSNASTVFNATDSFTKKHGRTPKISELASLTGLTTEQITEALEVSSPIISLWDRVGNGDGMLYVSDIIPDSDTTEKIIDTLALEGAISHLSKAERQIILLRYFKNLTQTRVAEILGTSQVSVSRAEKKIINKLRQEIL